MTKKLTVIFLLSCHISPAQNNPQPTQFDKFVSKPKIEWAAHASDTFNFTNTDFNNLLLNRLGKKHIKASLPMESRTGSANQIKYTIKDSIDNAFYGANADVVIDSAGNTISLKRVVPQKDTSNFKLTEVAQILYVENGKLKSYIPFVTPTLPVFISTGKYIGERFYFTTCFNYKYNCKPRKINKLIFLKQTKKMIKLDPEQKTDQLKNMYGKNLLETLWPYVLENKIEVISVDGKRKLKPEELNINLFNTTATIAPIYDSVGNIVQYDVVTDPIDLKRVQLIQDWYYDYRKNKVFSHIIEMVLYLNKVKKEDNEEWEPVLRLLFK